MSNTDSPLTGPPPAEVALSESPLVRVIAQVRFPLILYINNQDFVAPFQEAIREDYPVLQKHENRGVMVGPGGQMEVPTGTVWQFQDKANQWRVVLGQEFLALETSTYKSRDDFIQRLKLVLAALKEHFDPRVVERLGVRYIDRVAYEEREQFLGLIREDAAGILGTDLADHVLHTISDSRFSLPDGSQVTARWGLIPAGAICEPIPLDAYDHTGWFLDIDAFRADQLPLDVQEIVQQTRKLAERVYSIFRWIVTDNFLKHYGGNP